VIISYRPGEVRLESASPSLGFEMEVDSDGPSSVRVEFESNNLRVRVEARWSDGELRTEIDEDGDSG
jgi:hypothetical protein